MFRNVWLTVTMMIGAIVALSQATEANAAAAAPLNVLQIEKFFEPDPLVENVHGWHCRGRRGPFGWHRHRRACGGYYDDPYDDPYYDDGRYYDGGPSIVIRPRRKRARYRCSRKRYRHCVRSYRSGSKRYRRCMRKYGC